jgi:hypothetical protein
MCGELEPAGAAPEYGTDVSLTSPTPRSATPVTNPHYKGVISTDGTPDSLPQWVEDGA